MNTILKKTISTLASLAGLIGLLLILSENPEQPVGSIIITKGIGAAMILGSVTGLDFLCRKGRIKMEDKA